MSGNLLKYDYHIHTVYSGHADDDTTIENIIRTAENNSIHTIGITEHLRDISDYQNSKIIYDEINSIDTDINVIFGVEADISVTDIGKKLAVQPHQNTDFVIGSLHFWSIINQFWVDPISFDYNTKLDLYKELIEIYSNIIQSGTINIIGHFGVMLARLDMFDNGFNDSKLKDDIIKLLDLCKKNNIAIELNELIEWK